MTRRERMERRADQLREWAAKRETKADAVFKASEPFRSDHAFNTQPGHIPFRARLIAREERACESLAKAADMKSRAAGIADAVDRSIFSDDADAIEHLEARIREREAECARIVSLNKRIRAEVKHGLIEGWMDRCEMTDAEKRELLRLLKFSPGFNAAKPTIPSYVTANLRNLIRADRERIESIKRQAARREQAEANGGVSIQKSSDGSFCQITFAEKPERVILNALKAVGFWYSCGMWNGPTSKIPAEVQALLS